MRVDRSTMQEVVKRMVGRDLLSRRLPPNDRRTHELWLGPNGGQTLARHFHAMGTLQERLLTGLPPEDASRSEEHTSELQSLMSISYTVFCWTKKTNKKNN